MEGIYVNWNFLGLSRVLNESPVYPGFQNFKKTMFETHEFGSSDFRQLKKHKKKKKNCKYKKNEQI